MTEKAPRASKKIVFDLMANAKDSLAHAVSHLTDGDAASAGRWKIAIREVAHVIELLLKEKLRRAHPALIWVKVDDYPSLDARTVGTDLAASRLSKMCGIAFPKGALATLDTCRKLRNKIEHYEIQVEEAEARGIVGRMLSFIFTFSKLHLEIDLEEEFRKDDTWASLIEIYEFREAKAAEIEKRFQEEEVPSDICPSCGEPTFNLDAEECELCGHVEQQAECDHCHSSFWESEVEHYEDPESGHETTLCEKCIQDSDAADYQYDQWREQECEREQESDHNI
jgi:hypothetical protein